MEKLASFEQVIYWGLSFGRMQINEDLIFYFGLQPCMHMIQSGQFNYLHSLIIFQVTI